MFNIRLAGEEDIEVILEMGRKFYGTTEQVKMIPFDDDSGAAQVFGMLDNGFILLAETEGKEVAGMLGMTFHDFPFNRAYQVCVETMFWIEEDYRGGSLAARLLKEAEQIAVHEGVSVITMAALETSPKMIDGFYGRLGYRQAERTFIKGV